MTTAAIILQVGKVELRAVPPEGIHGAPPRYLRFMRPARPLFARPSDYGTEAIETAKLDISTITLTMHRMFGFSVPVAYWHDSWTDAWAIEELLKWEGREDEIRHDKFYADFCMDFKTEEPPPPTVRPSLSAGKNVLMIEEKNDARIA